jgi:hypothetical protein
VWFLVVAEVSVLTVLLVSSSAVAVKAVLPRTDTSFKWEEVAQEVTILQNSLSFAVVVQM